MRPGKDDFRPTCIICNMPYSDEMVAEFDRGVEAWVDLSMDCSTCDAKIYQKRNFPSASRV